MGRRRVGGPKNWSCDPIEEACITLDCRYMPHGFYSLVPAMLASMAFLTAALQDGCDYAKVEGDSVEIITGSDVLPYLEVGLSQYRVPLYYPTSGTWKSVYTEACASYPDDPAGLWNTARWLSFCSNVIGGGVALFLWCSICFTFSVRTWKFCAFEALLTGFLRSGSFFFLLSDICTQEGSSCSFYFGSQMDAAGVVLWFMCGLAMCGHYPDPRLRKLTEAEMEDEMTKAAMAEHDQDLAPKRLQPPTTTTTTRNDWSEAQSYAQSTGQSQYQGSQYSGDIEYQSQYSAAGQSQYSGAPSQYTGAPRKYSAEQSNGRSAGTMIYKGESSVRSRSIYSSNEGGKSYAYDEQSYYSKGGGDAGGSYYGNLESFRDEE